MLVNAFRYSAIGYPEMYWYKKKQWCGAGVQVQAAQNNLICQNFGQISKNVGKDVSTFFHLTRKFYFFVTECINKSLLCHRQHIKDTYNQQIVSSNFVF